MAGVGTASVSIFGRQTSISPYQMESTWYDIHTCIRWIFNLGLQLLLGILSNVLRGYYGNCLWRNGIYQQKIIPQQ